MRLFETIIEANHRAVAGDKTAGVCTTEYQDELPVIALTCVDPRLNPLFPAAMGLPGEQFIWLRNAGNIITGPLSSTMRSLALACAVKGGKEIVVIGHTDCAVCKTSTMELLERLKTLGIERHVLPENINDYFGMFGSERQNVIKACEIVRNSPIIGPKIPVQGLLVDISTGKLEWLVNGYQTMENFRGKWNEVAKSAGHTVNALKALTDFQIGDMRFPETKIGETVTRAEDWLSKKLEALQTSTPPELPAPGSAESLAEKMIDFAGKHWPKDSAPEEGPKPPKIPTPPPVRPRMTMRKRGNSS